jgi:hypothetical protein
MQVWTSLWRQKLHTTFHDNQSGRSRVISDRTSSFGWQTRTTDEQIWKCPQGFLRKRYTGRMACFINCSHQKVYCCSYLSLRSILQNPVNLEISSVATNFNPALSPKYSYSCNKISCCYFPVCYPYQLSQILSYVSVRFILMSLHAAIKQKQLQAHFPHPCGLSPPRHQLCYVPCQHFPCDKPNEGASLETTVGHSCAP